MSQIPTNSYAIAKPRNESRIHTLFIMIVIFLYVWMCVIA